MPILTLDQYCFIFFAESFRHHNLISENIFLLKEGLDKYRDSSPVLKLAHSVLQHLCDENFFLVFKGLKTSMAQLFQNEFSKGDFEPKTHLETLKAKLEGEKQLNQLEVDFLVREMGGKRKAELRERVNKMDGVFYASVEQLIMSFFIGQAYDL